MKHPARIGNNQRGCHQLLDKGCQAIDRLRQECGAYWATSTGKIDFSGNIDHKSIWKVKQLTNGMSSLAIDIFLVGFAYATRISEYGQTTIGHLDPFGDIATQNHKKWGDCESRKGSQSNQNLGKSHRHLWTGHSVTRCLILFKLYRCTFTQFPKNYISHGTKRGLPSKNSWAKGSSRTHPTELLLELRILLLSSHVIYLENHEIEWFNYHQVT